MTDLYFIRHAEPNYGNHDDLTRELSAKGMADRRLVTEYLAGKNIHAVLSSPFKRAADTVSGFAQSYGYEVEIVEDFRERGVDSGWIEDFDAFTRRQWADFDYRLSGGETLRQVQRRNIRALRQVLARYPEKAVAVGSHGTALCTIIQYFRPEFGYEGFQRIRNLMPWVVHFSFAGQDCVRIESYNLFTKEIFQL